MLRCWNSQVVRMGFLKIDEVLTVAVSSTYLAYKGF